MQVDVSTLMIEVFRYLVIRKYLIIALYSSSLVLQEIRNNFVIEKMKEG